jgi:hypothetical protein
MLNAQKILNFLNLSVKKMLKRLQKKDKSPASIIADAIKQILDLDD